MAETFVRKDVWSLSDDDPIIVAYADAVAAMMAKPRRDPTSWAYQAAIHGSLATKPKPAWNQCRHGGWYFVSWHRMYLYYFERIVRAQVVQNGGPADWALPYWNYDGGGRHNRLPRPFRHPQRPDGSANPLYVANRARRINRGAGLPAAITSPAFALSRTAFTGVGEFGGGRTSPLGQFWSSTGRLEQTPHNDVHVAIGGLMGDPDTAAADPIFWLHHANIDRLWWLWEKTHTDAKRKVWRRQPFDFFDVGGVAVSSRAAGILRTKKQLHYTYDQPPSVAARTRSLAVREERVNARWPGAWPTRPADAPAPDPGAAPRRELVGATEEPIELTGTTRSISVPIDQRTLGDLQRSLGAATQQRAYLDVEDIDAERQPGVVYGVYVNLPDEPTAEDLALLHVGNVSLFGVERARNPRGDVHAHGLRVSMEITGVLDRLAESGAWRDGERIGVTFRPIDLEPPEGEEDEEGPEDEEDEKGEEGQEGPELAEQRDQPEGAGAGTAEPTVRIGRVSVHFA